MLLSVTTFNPTQQLFYYISVIILESNADAHTSSEVDLLLQQLGWCHGEKGQTEGWISPQQQEMNIQKINNSLKGEGRPEEVIKEVTRVSGERVPADFDVKNEVKFGKTFQNIILQFTVI